MIQLKIDVMGVKVDNLSMEEALDAAEALLSSGEKGFCVTPNAEILYRAIGDPAYRAILNRALLVLPDGAGTVFGAKLLGHPMKEKVPGIDFADNLCGRLAKNGRKLFLLGSKEGVAEIAAENLRSRYPGLQICGTHHGYFTDPEPVIARINAAEPDVLFVCMGAPKQEQFMDTYKDRLSARFSIGLGGSLDVFSGTTRRAPKWIRKCNLEWLYRTLQDPARMIRNTSRTKFVWACLKERRHRLKNG